MDKKMITFGLLVLVAIAAAGYGASHAFRKEQMVATQLPAEASQMQPITVILHEQNASGQSGTATLTEMQGKTQVTLTLMGNPKDIAQPAHIHTGTCATIGGVVHPLTSPVNGTSITTIDVPLASILEGLPLAINVHKSAQEPGIFFACGDIMWP